MTTALPPVPAAGTVERYGCTFCRRYHYSTDPEFLEHEEWAKAAPVSVPTSSILARKHLKPAAALTVRKRWCRWAHRQARGIRRQIDEANRIAEERQREHGQTAYLILLAPYLASHRRMVRVVLAHHDPRWWLDRAGIDLERLPILSDRCGCGSGWVPSSESTGGFIGEQSPGNLCRDCTRPIVIRQAVIFACGHTATAQIPTHLSVAEAAAACHRASRSDCPCCMARKVDGWQHSALGRPEKAVATSREALSAGSTPVSLPGGLTEGW